MFDKMGDKIDAVTVSTPDHCHAVVAMAAIKLGKHVYCQKPMTHSIAEARALQEAARKYKVSHADGEPGYASDEFRRGVEMLQAGTILGPVKEVHVWTNRPIWPQAPQITERPKDTPPVPRTFTGTCSSGRLPERPYSPIYQPFNWRGWWDFGTGALGDMGCHTVNMPFMGLQARVPDFAFAARPATSIPRHTRAGRPSTYEFPARGEMPPVKLVWWEGHKGKKPQHPRSRHHPWLRPSRERLAGDRREGNDDVDQRLR